MDALLPRTVGVLDKLAVKNETQVMEDYLVNRRRQEATNNEIMLAALRYSPSEPLDLRVGGERSRTS